MLLRTIRYVLPVLLAVCHLTLAFPTQTPFAYDEVRSLQVNIPQSGPASAPLGSSISIPCLVSLSSTPTTTSSSSPIVPRVKWAVVSDGVETQILVARGQRVKVNEAYRDRAALLNYTSSPDDLSLWLGDLRSSDSGHYRCEVQQGLEDASDVVQLKVKGVVFHYRDALGRYAFSFHQAQRACEAIGAEIATADQLLAAYYDGYEQCDAGWLADQSVRYPIQVPREGCYGDMDGQPGVRNYGTMDPDDLFDVYCYVEQIHGEVFHDFIPQQLSFDEAQSYCRAAGAEVATTAQLYLAWSEGLDRCSPGWLSDGSVRYPIITPRERCGGPQAGVKTVYRFSNQTGFPEPSSLHDVYCFKENGNGPTVDYIATDSEDIGQDVVILTETDLELQLNQHAEQVEREAQSALESFPFVSQLSTEENLVDINPTVMTEATESPLNATSTLGHPQPFNESLYPTEMSSLRPTKLINSTIIGNETYDVVQNSSSPPSVYNETYSHVSLNFTFPQTEPESTTEFLEVSYEPYTHNQTVSDTNPEEHAQPSEGPQDSVEISENNLDLNRSRANFSEADPTRGENIPQTTPVTSGSMLQVKREESADAGTDQMSLWNVSPREEEEFHTLATEDVIRNQTSLWLPDGSGDNSQESNLDVDAVRLTASSASPTSGFTTLPPPSASASTTSGERWTSAPHPASSSGSPNTDNLGFDILSTAAQLWESPISKQEGSTSLESEDIVTLDSEENQLHLTTSEENLGSGTKLSTTESSEGSVTSQLPTGSTTAQYQTSTYKVYWDTATIAYEEASGQDPVTATGIIEGDVTFTQTLEDEIQVFPTTEDEANVSFSPEQEDEVSPTPVEDTTVTPTPEDGANIYPILEEEAEVSFSMEKEFDEEANVATTLEDETTIAPTPEYATGAPVPDKVNVSPTLTEEAIITTTLEEGAEVAQVLEDVEQDEVAPVVNEINVSRTLTEKTTITPTLEEGTEVAQVLEDVDAGPTPEQPYVAPTLEDKDNVSLPVEEDANVAFAPSVEDITILPLDSQTSRRALPTTTGPQTFFNDPDKSRKASPTSTAAPHSSSSTRPTRATIGTSTTTITTTTHWSRRTWSPITTKPRVFHKTTESPKVTHLIPPVDQGVVDVEFSLTQPPTLLILPNERAAVGGTGKASDACENDPCLNGGTCTDQDGQIKCLCLPTYGGIFCETDLERCEPGWDKFHGFCYRHFSQRLSWEVAEQQCRMQGAHLVSIMTPEEQNYINSNYKEYQWTGLNDKTIEDDFRWSDGNPLLYENWYRGQPDSYFLSGEDCVVMVWHDDGRWSDVPCNYHLAYTCKKGTTSCGPPPKVRNAFVFGKVRQRYETNAVMRYHCAEGFQQRLNPLIRCLSGGVWERPQIMCTPVAGGPTLQPDVTSPTDNFAAIEGDFEATKEKPQYWDIRF